MQAPNGPPSPPADSQPLARAAILPESALPRAEDLIAQGRKLAGDWRVGRCAFLDETGMPCEIAFKERAAADGIVTVHSQIGYRDPEKSRRAWAEIHERVTRAGGRVDRYGICLDWSMGYPRDRRDGMPRGTGLLLDDTDGFAALTAQAPVAPHFGDFVLGMPAAVENAAAALAAGSTTIGNMGQYFTFRLPHWDDDVATTEATVTALALCAAQPVPVLIHSNLDDGFAALFADLACALGAVLLERHVVEGLLGCRMGHCYGHTFSDPVSRWAFQRALARIGGGPGTMIYGNTTAYRAEPAANYAALAAYLGVDIMAQRTRPTGHAVNPVPVTEAQRIPEIDEVVDAAVFAARLIEAGDGLAPLYDDGPADAMADRLVAGGRAFRDRVLAGLTAAGIDTGDAVETLLALKRVGARRLEALFGPGAAGTDDGRRAPLVPSPVIVELEARADEALANAGEPAIDAVRRAGLCGCIATTDVHEYGKVLVEKVLGRLGVETVDAGVSADPDDIAERARAGGADFVALSTYNGVALGFVRQLKAELATRGLDVPLFVGGKLNEIPDASNTSLPVDVTADIAAAGAVPCPDAETLIRALAGPAGTGTTSRKEETGS